jgi:hypothetical protein
VICKTKFRFRRSYSIWPACGFRTGSPHKTNGLELNPTFCFPSSRFKRTIQVPLACWSFCLETTNSGIICFRAEPADSISPALLLLCPNTLRAFRFCNPHLASAPNQVQRALGKERQVVEA